MHASQKQALSYTHNIVSVDSDNRLCTPEAVHSALSVEIPDPDTNLELFQLVKKFMVHGPCGIHSPNAPYMDKPRSAPKTFPSPFKTIPISEDSPMLFFVVMILEGHLNTISFGGPPPTWKAKCHLE